jgi:hypothetical protein
MRKKNKNRWETQHSNLVERHSNKRVELPLRPQSGVLTSSVLQLGYSRGPFPRSDLSTAMETRRMRRLGVPRKSVRGKVFVRGVM